MDGEISLSALSDVKFEESSRDDKVTWTDNAYVWKIQNLTNVQNFKLTHVYRSNIELVWKYVNLNC